MTIMYDEKNKKVTQKLDYRSFYKIEGYLDVVLNEMRGLFDELIDKYTKQENEIKEGYNSRGGYLDGVTKKSVKFDKIKMEIEDEPYGEGSKCLMFYGERDWLPEELDVFNDKERKTKDAEEQREKILLEKLLKKYPEVKG